ncbi:MAG: hypothetical protein Kow0077_11000 [Anaerolineae bacterium]
MGNFFKRLLSMLAVLILMVVTTAVLATPQLVADLATRLSEETPATTRTMMVVAALVIDLVLAAVLVRIIRPRKEDELQVRARGAKAKVSLDSVQRQINARIAQVSDVLHVHTDVEVTSGAASVELNVRTRPDIVIPEKQKEISRVLRQLVEKQMGLRLAGEPIIHLALATDEFDTTDHVTTIVEPATAGTPAAIAATSYTEVEAEEAPPPVARALPERASEAPQEAAAETQAASEETEQAPSEPEQDEPWRAFLLEDN